MGNTNTTLDLGQDVLGRPQILAQMLTLPSFLFEFTDEYVVIEALNELMKQIFNTLLTELQHFLETIPLKVTNDFNRLAKMGFTRVASKKGERAIIVETGLTLLATPFVSTRLHALQVVIGVLPFTLTRTPVVGFGMKFLLQSTLVLFDLSSHNGGVVTNDGDVDIGNGGLNLNVLVNMDKFQYKKYLLNSPDLLPQLFDGFDW